MGPMDVAIEADTLTFLRFMLAGLEVLSPILSALLGVIIVNGLVIGRLEGLSVGNAIYFAFVTATTVGYGDIRPSRGMSKVLAIANEFLGLLLTGVFVGVGVWAVEVALRLQLGYGLSGSSP